MLPYDTIWNWNVPNDALATGQGRPPRRWSGSRHFSCLISHPPFALFKAARSCPTLHFFNLAKGGDFDAAAAHATSLFIWSYDVLLKGFFFIALGALLLAKPCFTTWCAPGLLTDITPLSAQVALMNSNLVTFLSFLRLIKNAPESLALELQ